MFKLASVVLNRLGVGSKSIAYSDGNNVIKEVYGADPTEANQTIDSFRSTLHAPNKNVKVLYPKVVSYNNRTFLVTPFIKGEQMPEALGDDYYKSLVNYQEAKDKGLNYLDRGHSNFIKTEDGSIINVDPIGGIGENVRKTVLNKINTSPNSKLSRNKRELKKKLNGSDRFISDPYMWQLVQKEMENRTQMNPSLFSEVSSL